MPKIRAAIFDLDGTLIDAFSGYYAAYNHALRAIGVAKPLAQKEFGRYYGMTDLDIARTILEARRVNPTPRLLKKLIDTKRGYFFARGYKVMRILPSAREILKEMQRRGIKLALATSAQPSVLRRVNLKLKLNVFRAKVTGTEIAQLRLRGKPHPDEFLLAAKRLKARPSECVVFEDSVHGVRAGKRAGMRVVAVTTGKMSAARLKKERPFMVARNLKEALQKIDRILA